MIGLYFLLENTEKFEILELPEYNCLGFDKDKPISPKCCTSCGANYPAGRAPFIGGYLSGPAHNPLYRPEVGKSDLTYDYNCDKDGMPWGSCTNCEESQW